MDRAPFAARYRWTEARKRLGLRVLVLRTTAWPLWGIALPILNDKAIIKRTISAYSGAVTRAYSTARFMILRQRFLDEIGQYMPKQGRVLDIGCGFGLFSLYFAQKYPELQIHGMDLNQSRIDQAQKAAAQLGLTNATYKCGDARSFKAEERYDAAYMMDIIHHIPKEAVRPLIEQLAKVLEPETRLIIKDVDTEPAYKRWFTFIMDKLVDPHSPVRYWEASELMELLTQCGFDVHRHAMIDYLPYPHILYICTRTDSAQQ